jgi:hypothetical protein
MTYKNTIISYMLLVPTPQFKSRQKDLSKLSDRELNGLTMRCNYLHSAVRFERAKRLQNKNLGGLTSHKT